MKKPDWQKGSAYTRGNGRIVADIPYRDEDGKVRLQSVYKDEDGKVFATIEDAWARVYRARDQVRKGLPSKVHTGRIAGLLDDWLETAVIGVLAPKTSRTYQDHVRKHLKPEFGDLRAEELTKDRINRWLRAKEREEYAPGKTYSGRAVNDMLVTLGTALEHAVATDKVGRNVTRLPGIVRPKIVKHETPPISREQARWLQECIEQDSFGDAMTLVFHTGVRKGEALGLPKDCVNLRDRNVEVMYQLQRHEGELSLKSLKTPKSRRRIPMTPQVYEILSRRMALRGPSVPVAGEKRTLELVLCNTRGTPIRHKDLWKHFKEKVLPASGLDTRLTVHSLRHIAGSLMLEAGVDLKTVSEILGHASIKITGDLYLYVQPATSRNAIHQLGRVLTGVMTEEEGLELLALEIDRLGLWEPVSAAALKSVLVPRRPVALVRAA
jgi:integrase